MKKLVLYIAIAMSATLPALLARIAGWHPGGVIEAAMAGVAILGAGFMLSWGVEAAEEHVARGLALGVLALITVLPEYVVDLYYAFQGGRNPASHYAQFAAANMTGANRMLVGIGWPLIALLYWWRSGRRAIELHPNNSVEIAFLVLGTVYSFVIVGKGRIDAFDFVVLFALFALYLWRLAKLPKSPHDSDDDDGEPGPAAALATLPRRRQYAVIAALAVFAGAVILVEAEPFAESLVSAAGELGVNKFLLIQWISPLAGEAPEIVITVLFVLSLRPTYALGALISDKINQWTLLVGTLPLIYSLGAGRLTALPLDARQNEEFLLTAGQSLFAVALLLRLRFTAASALVLLVLFVAQLTIAFVLQSDEARSIGMLTGFAWVYLVAAGVLFIVNYRHAVEHLRSGLLTRGSAEQRRTAHTQRERG